MTRIKLTIWFVLIILTPALFIGCRKKPQSPPADANKISQKSSKPALDATTTPTPQAPKPQQTNPQASSVSDPPAAPQPQQAVKTPKPTLAFIAEHARSWLPAYTDWYGKTAPDFTVVDITGKTQKLSDYKGRNVMVIFWATWCGPCREEIPSLIKLRKEMGQDQLAMLAISVVGPRSPTEGVKQFIAANPVINYTIISTDAVNMPVPFNMISAIPTTFFVNPDGTVKFATEGTTPYSHIKAILAAEQ
jgi:peroxiredoxin